MAAFSLGAAEIGAERGVLIERAVGLAVLFERPGVKQVGVLRFMVGVGFDQMFEAADAVVERSEFEISVG